MEMFIFLDEPKEWSELLQTRSPKADISSTSTNRQCLLHSIVKVVQHAFELDMPTIETILQHPRYWHEPKFPNFICAFYDNVKDMTNQSEIRDELELKKAHPSLDKVNLVITMTELGFDLHNHRSELPGYNASNPFNEFKVLTFVKHLRNFWTLSRKSVESLGQQQRETNDIAEHQDDLKTLESAQQIQNTVRKVEERSSSAAKSATRMNLVRKNPREF